MGSHGPLDNANPLVREREQVRRGSRDAEATKAGPLDAEAWWTWGLEAEGEGGVEDAASAREPIDAIEVFEHIRDIADPEHPYSLEQLGVVSASHIEVDDAGSTVIVKFTPTVAHCSMATLIGLCIRTKIMRVLPARFKVRVALTEGSHSTEEAVNKQLMDKERVLAALENPNLANLVDKCLLPTEKS